MYAYFIYKSMKIEQNLINWKKIDVDLSITGCMCNVCAW